MKRTQTGREEPLIALPALREWPFALVCAKPPHRSDTVFPDGSTHTKRVFQTFDSVLGRDHSSSSSEPGFGAGPFLAPDSLAARRFSMTR
ncbi:MAG: hypothetical protein RIS45_1492 [Planctomycetota bacterium]|jgi:hypothetical protein